MKILLLLVVTAAMAAVTAVARAEAPGEFLARYEAAARAADPAFRGAVPRGADFFRARHGAEWSCSSCHTENPAAPGRHATTGKPIQPLAPSANAQRFANPEKVEKWFRRNCKDVVGRECSPGEKADIVAWLISIQ